MYCQSDKTTLGILLLERASYDVNPVYQRPSGRWSVEKQQFLIDSIFNRYDIPKIYLHDLRDDSTTHFQFAVVDGKQRLQALWDFQEGAFGLLDAVPGEGNKPDLEAGAQFKDLGAHWQEWFKGQSLDVVHIRNADEEGVEELFSRLNNGEPLSSAEKRNATPGPMTQLIRDIADRDFFKSYVRFSNSKFQHREAAAKLMLVERNEMLLQQTFSDLKKRYLDDLAKNKKLDGAELVNAQQRRKLQQQVDANLRHLCKVFERQDTLLQAQASVPMYYSFTKLMARDYADPSLFTKIQAFLPSFHAMRMVDRDKPEDQRDPYLAEFDGLSNQATNDRRNIERRVELLTAYFLAANPEITLKDTARAFNDSERLAIYVMAGKKCEVCGIRLETLSDMHADHVKAHAIGGPTKIANARCLCMTDNEKLATTARRT